MHVRCPCCSWRPDGRAYWGCDRCPTTFDTFSTHARCPGCGQTYLETQCIACHEWSLHEDWYDGDMFAGREEKETLKVGF